MTRNSNGIATFAGAVACFGVYATDGTASGYTPAVVIARTSTSPDAPLLPPLIAQEVTVGTDVHLIKRNSGLTWDELARVLRVTRRTLHNWANGRPTSLTREASIKRFRAFLREIDTGEAIKNRALILGEAGKGRLVLDLIRAGDWEAAITAARRVKPQRSLHLPMSDRERATDYFDANWDRDPTLDGGLSKRQLVRRRPKRE